jgi:hypothetical protein
MAIIIIWFKYSPYRVASSRRILCATESVLAVNNIPTAILFLSLGRGPDWALWPVFSI